MHVPDDLKARPRVVVDTCVALRAMCHRLFPSSRPELAQQEAVSFNALALARRHFALCFTKETRRELVHILATRRRERLTGQPRRAFERLAFSASYIEPFALLVPPGPTGLVCRDPDDQMLLHAAAGARASYLVSTDNDLLVLERDGLCRFVTPQEFIRSATAEINRGRLQQAVPA